MDELVFNVTPDQEDGSYVAVAVGEGLATQGDTWDELCFMVMDAAKLYYDGALTPKRIRLCLHMEQVLLTA